MRKSEAWWTCGSCGERVTRVGKKRVLEAMRDHTKETGCHPGFSIEQVEQRKGA